MPTSTPENQNATASRTGKAVVCDALVRPHFFRAPRGYAEPDGEYRSRFNFVWWFWLPRLHLQSPVVLNGYHNPRVIRVIWLCFAVGVNIGHDGTLPNAGDVPRAGNGAAPKE
jgi:hypothetical protein